MDPLGLRLRHLTKPLQVCPCDDGWCAQHSTFRISLMAIPTNAIFLCYRRQDTADSVDRICDALEKDLPPGAIYRDLDSIPAGTDFPLHVERAIGACTIALIVIGPSWLRAWPTPAVAGALTYPPTMCVSKSRLPCGCRTWWSFPCLFAGRICRPTTNYPSRCVRSPSAMVSTCGLIPTLTAMWHD
jgi:TIR domain